MASGYAGTVAKVSQGLIPQPFSIRAFIFNLFYVISIIKKPFSIYSSGRVKSKILFT
jgi:hypothetical protein